MSEHRGHEPGEASEKAQEETRWLEVLLARMERGSKDEKDMICSSGLFDKSGLDGNITRFKIVDCLAQEPEFAGALDIRVVDAAQRLVERYIVEAYPNGLPQDYISEIAGRAAKSGRKLDLDALNRFATR